MHRNKEKKIKNNVFFFFLIKQSHFTVIKVHSNFPKRLRELWTFKTMSI
jgi:hypothetical protein